jgi:hypothetical protein
MVVMGLKKLAVAQDCESKGYLDSTTHSNETSLPDIF